MNFGLHKKIFMPNKSLEPTRVGALSSAIAVRVFWSRVAQLWRWTPI